MRNILVLIIFLLTSWVCGGGDAESTYLKFKNLSGNVENC